MPLGLADAEMVPNYVGDDLVWGVKSFDSDHGRFVVWEVIYLNPGDEKPMYVREKTQVGTSLPNSLHTLGRIVTDSEFRSQLQESLEASR